jgi:hypothetical protein
LKNKEENTSDTRFKRSQGHQHDDTTLTRRAT